MNSTSALALAALSVLIGACSSSSTHETSDAGPKMDATTPDGGHDDDDAEGDDAGDAGMDTPPTPIFSLDAGSTWTALYRDYFGNNTQANTAGCANQSYCHGSKTGEGYQASQYLCPKGDKAACYASLTSQSATMGPQLITADASANSDLLTQVLCRVDDAGNPTGDGTMPQDCVYSFTPTDMQRITDWIKAGYPDN